MYRPVWTCRAQHGGVPSSWAAASPREAFVGSCRRRRRPLPARAATGAQHGSSPSDSALTSDGEPDVEALLLKAANLVATSHLLVPYDNSEVSLALVVWQAVRDIPEALRPRLLGMLSPGAIKRLWRVAGERYSAQPRLVAAAIGPDYSIWTDLPDRQEQIVHFGGRAALPAYTLGAGRFGASFFLHPESEKPYVRLAVLGPLGELLYPLYCSCDVGQEVVPGAEELCDLTLSFKPPEQLGLTLEDIPRSAWPRPRRPLPPFNEGFVGFVRAAGPGVYVGKGIRTLAPPAEPLYFVMARQGVDDLLA